MEHTARPVWYAPDASAPPAALAEAHPALEVAADVPGLRQALEGSLAIVVAPATSGGGVLAEVLSAAEGRVPVVAVFNADAPADRAVEALRAGAAEVLCADADAATVQRTFARALARFVHAAERRRAAASMRASEARLRALTEALPDAIVRIDTTGRILDFHVPASFPAELMPPDVVGKYAQDVLPDDMKPPYAAAAIEAFRTRRPVTFRHTTLINGAPRHHEVCCVPNGSDEVLALIRDQTVQVEAEAALREQERLTRHIVSTVPVIVFALDAAGRFELIEGKGLEDIGRTQAELEGVLVPEVFGDNDAIMTALHAALEGEAGRTLILLNGHHFDLWFNPVHGDDGALTGVIGIAANVSELVEAQAELERSRAELRELAVHLQRVREEERTRLSREVHDRLGQTLTSIRLDASWVARHRATAGADAVAARLRRVDAQVDEAIERVRGIAQALRPGILDNIGLASALDWEARQFAARTGLACTFYASLRSDEAELPGEAATALFRIAQEALTNVARHADALAVTLHLEETDDALVLDVRDDGRGLDPDRAATARSLGMLGMRERAGILGGTVELDSVPGEGTHLRAAVPLAL